MMIDWDNAPEGATHWCLGNRQWYKVGSPKCSCYDESLRQWIHTSLNNVQIETSKTFTPRPTEPTPYTRDEALQFLVDNLDEWPTAIDDAPLCAGWGWRLGIFGNPYMSKLTHDKFIEVESWLIAQGLSHPQQQDPATAEQPAPDMVNHPPHYQSDNGIECIDAIRAALGHEGFVAYCIGNSMKYLWRNKVSKAEDLRKAAWYLNRASVEIEQHDNPQTER